MISLFIILFLIYLSLVGYSLFFKNIIIKSHKNIFYNLDIFYGIFLVSLILIFLNFFVPLIFFTYIFFPVGIFLLSIFKKKFIFNNNFYFFGLILFFFIFISYSNSNLLAGDTPFYHLQNIKWLSNYKISFGLANLEPRYGLNSLWHILISLYNITLFNINPIYHFNLIIYSIFLSEIFNKKNFENFKISYVYLYCTGAFLLIFSLIHPMINGSIFLNLGSPEVDTVCMILFILTSFVFLKNDKFEDQNNSNILIILVTLCLLTKISYSITILFLIFLIFKKRNFLKIKILPYIVIINILWIFRNLIISGCALFPIRMTCFNFPWSYDKNDIDLFSNIIQSFARDAPYRSKYMDFDYTLNSYDWVAPWFKSYFLETSILVISLTILILSLIFIILKYLIFKKIEIDTNAIILILICFFGIIIWLKAPDVRFGYGFIISLSTILVALSFKNLNLSTKIINRNLLNFIFLLIIFSNIVKNHSNFDKINSNIQYNFNYNNFVLLSKTNGYEIYKPPPTFSCGFFQDICVYHDGNYNILSKYKYLTFYKLK